MVVIVPYELSKGKKLTVRNTFNQPENSHRNRQCAGRHLCQYLGELFPLSRKMCTRTGSS